MNKTIRNAIAFIFLALLQISTVLAIEIVENYCNDRAQQGTWKRGLQNQTEIDNITREFNPQHQLLVSFLDRQPPNTNERTVLEGIGAKPFSTTRVIKDYAIYQWEIPGATYSLGIQVEFYKGCITQIIMMNMANKTTYHRHNKLERQP